MYKQTSDELTKWFGIQNVLREFFIVVPILALFIANVLGSRNPNLYSKGRPDIPDNYFEPIFRKSECEQRVRRRSFWKKLTENNEGSLETVDNSGEGSKV